jgi:hypothetical protein
MVRSSKENQIKKTLLGFCTNTFSCGSYFPGMGFMVCGILGKERMIIEIRGKATLLLQSHV